MVHLPHSIVSFHMVYCPGEFDEYDVIFCSGEHHIKELKEIYGEDSSKVKMAKRIGYGRLDYLYAEMSKMTPSPSNQNNLKRKQILVAPSWSAGNVLESIGIELFQTLIDNGYKVVFRPHPIYYRIKQEKLTKLRHALEGTENFTIEEPTQSNRSLFESDIMISDYSGVAYEFAFLRNKPVLFVDAPQKIQNPNWNKISAAPMELELRNKVGVLVAPNIPEIISGIEHLSATIDEYKNKIEELRPYYAFNFPEAGIAAERALSDLLGTLKVQ